MFSANRLSWPLLTGVFLVTCASLAQAAVVPNIGLQGPKNNLNDPAPPAVAPNSDIGEAITAFTQKMTSLGGNEFEGNQLGFGFTGGTATVAGGAFLQAGVNATPSLGRYNMTPNLPPNSFGLANPGNWLEANSSFTLNFTGTAVTAFSFFATDLGDYDGEVWLDVRGGDDNSVLYSQRLENNLGVTGTGPGETRNTAGANGNLLYFGITSSLSSQYFRSVTFTIGSPGAGDFVGFDSFVVGKYTGPTGTPIPEPGSLALVGLALAAAGLMRRRKA